MDSVYQSKLFKNEYGLNKWKKMNYEEKESTFQLTLAGSHDSNLLMDIMNTGYQHAIQIIKSTIHDNACIFVTDNLTNILEQIADNYDIDTIKRYNDLHQQFIRIFDQKLYDIFWKNIEFSITNYVNNIMIQDVRIKKSGYLLKYEVFSIFYRQIQNQYINLAELIEYLSHIPLCPMESLSIHQKRLLTKIMQMYDYISFMEYHTAYVAPDNLINYLQFINKYNNSQFDKYVDIFLNIVCHEKMIYTLDNKIDILKLLNFIKDHTKTTQKGAPLILLQKIYKILINIQHNMGTETFEHSFQYFIKMKYLVKKIINTTNATNNMMLCLLIEIINKNISVHIGTPGIVNLYKPEFDYHKVICLLDNITFESIDINIDFEIGLLNLAKNIDASNLFFL
jgi:hypothetical protein